MKWKMDIHTYIYIYMYIYIYIYIYFFFLYCKTIEHSVMRETTWYPVNYGEPDMGQLKRDLDTFHRNLRIKTFFDPSKGDLESNNGTHNDGGNDDTSEFDTLIRKSKVLRPNKKWAPPMGPLHLESFILTNERDLNKTFPKAPNFHNLTKEEKEGIRKLSSNKDLVIKPADKGGATVIIDKRDYITEGKRQLSDSNFRSHRK